MFEYPNYAHGPVSSWFNWFARSGKVNVMQAETHQIRTAGHEIVSTLNRPPAFNELIYVPGNIALNFVLSLFFFARSSQYPLPGTDSIEPL